MSALGFFLLLILLVVVVFVLKGIRIVQQAEVMIIDRLGRYHATLESGINIIIPIIDQPRAIDWRYAKTDPTERVIYVTTQTTKIDLRETVYDSPRQNVITKDNVNIEINALVYFQITDPVKSVYEIANLPDAIQKLTQTTLRNVVGEMDLDETLTSRDTINGRLRSILDEATNKWGVKINRVEIQDITPSKDTQEAMEKQMRAERDRRAAILNAEASKKSAILEAEGKKDAQINVAEGEKRAAILRAEGQAEAARKIAEAMAKVAETSSQYLLAVRYLETLKEVASGQTSKIIFLPYEATGVLSSLGAIKEMFEDGKP